MRISDWSSDVCSSDLLIINGVHFVIGSAGVRLDGPSDDKYRHSICITGCQFDAMTTNTMVLSRLAMFHVFANNYQTGKDASLTSLDFSASIFEGKDYLALRGQIGRASCRERVCQYV